ncbi:MAG: ABC transporter ATP-binding protein [Candidatus Verstraetearchaeota archaeon]|jgi:ABC-type lipoprotein export system ATPase subunit|nr:ABC transporter ATP-binding protein [Candidatus Verstraetearchaeota archaeon]
MIELRNITKIYNKGKPNEVIALKDINMKIEEGKITVITGPSGCGKTTLLSIIGLILTPTYGDVIYNGENVTKYSDYWKTKFRRENIGFIFQHINLLPGYNALENILLPLYSMDLNPMDYIDKAMELLSRLKVLERAKHKVEQLSGGEQQRIAFVRALIKDPKYILADEPTVFVDEETSHIIHNIMEDLRDKGKTIIISTHDPELIKIADKVYRLYNGRLIT